MMTIVAGTVTVAEGIRAAGVHCGIKPTRPDLALIATEAPAAVAACFTTNRAAAAPVQVSRAQMSGGRAQAVVVNSGNANACTGPRGLADAREMIGLTARALGLPEDLVLVCSTGVIGIPLPMDAVRRGITDAAAALASDEAAGEAAAQAIMTTDAFPKTGAVHLEIDGTAVATGGMAKGAGMIHPRMATMLAVLTTDAAVDPGLLQRALRHAVDRSFNCISVDGDTSTNDTVIVLATGAAGHRLLRSEEDPGFARFQDALNGLTRHLARLIVQDGEGATRLIEIVITGAHTRQEARLAGEAIATSPLVKTAAYGMEPNWGRVVAAVGRSGAELDLQRLSVTIGEARIVEGGVGRPEFLGAAAAAMRQPEFAIAVDLGTGAEMWRGWTCDLTQEYVRINSGYLT